MSYIINIETSTKICSVNLSKSGQLIDYIETVDGNAHAANLAPFINTIITRNNLIYSNLSAIAISQGPGSYTGLRIGTSTAKGLCFALNIPLIAINTLESMAFFAKTKTQFDGIYQPMIDARRMEVYTQSFNNQIVSITDVNPVIIDENSFSDLLLKNKVMFFGDGAEKCKEMIKHKNAVFYNETEASSLGMCELSFAKFENKEFEDVAYFEPVYLKEFIALTSKIKGLR